MEKQRKQNIILFVLRNHTLQYRPLAELLQGRALVLKGALLWYFVLTIYLNINGCTKCLPAFNNQTLTNYLIWLNYKSHIHFFSLLLFSYFRALKLTETLWLNYLRSYTFLFLSHFSVTLPLRLISLSRWNMNVLPSVNFLADWNSFCCVLQYPLFSVISVSAVTPIAGLVFVEAFLNYICAKKIALKFWNLSI